MIVLWYSISENDAIFDSVIQNEGIFVSIIQNGVYLIP